VGKVFTYVHEFVSDSVCLSVRAVKAKRLELSPIKVSRGTVRGRHACTDPEVNRSPLGLRLGWEGRGVGMHVDTIVQFPVTVCKGAFTSPYLISNQIKSNLLKAEGPDGH